MLRLIHNRSIVKYFLAALGIAFAFYFAWSFYPFGEWVGNHFLQDAPGGPELLGLISRGHPRRLRPDCRLLQRIHQRRHRSVFAGYR